jgi:hypothetical protein
MSFTEWTVLPHDPIEKLASNLWSVSGTMPKGNQRRMTLARLGDGRLVVHNAIALDPGEMKEIDAFGQVAAIVVPNAFHRMDARIWKDRYPNAKVYCPKKATKAVNKVVSVDGDYDAIPQDGGVHAVHLNGMGGAEGVIEVESESGRTLVFNDAILNMQSRGPMMDLMLGPVGKPSVPRFMRWFMVKDKPAFREHLAKLAAGGVQRIIVGHGATVDRDTPAIVQDLLAQMR